MDSRIYVIGHVNPDTDTIAAAMGYAWLLRERDGADAVAARAGAINPQTTWILKRLELEAPSAADGCLAALPGGHAPPGYHHTRQPLARCLGDHQPYGRGCAYR